MGRLPRSGALLAAGLAAAFSLTACGSDGPAAAPDGGRGPGRSTPSAAGGEDAAPEHADVAALEGTWAGTAGGSPVVLSVTSGKAALVAGQHVCQGEVKDMDGTTLVLKCLDGNTERTMGAVDSDGGEKLVVSWDDGPEDTLTRTEADELPTGPPEAPEA
ncbi:hypothetical protein [Streptomyces sp. NBC_01185]|uniref:hypothetical protein n=1 Tax=Streptomyces sp. NBC_01185 TaxID=2903764 RepID=UPI00386955B7|nr:hypothetical protein OG770_20365 [Streptomyces sp. NBC_01185]